MVMHLPQQQAQGVAGAIAAWIAHSDPAPEMVEVLDDLHRAYLAVGSSDDLAAADEAMRTIIAADPAWWRRVVDMRVGGDFVRRFHATDGSDRGQP